MQSSVQILFGTPFYEKIYKYIIKQAPVVTGMSHARSSRWGMLLHVNEAGTDYIYGGQNKIGVHVFHVGIAIHA